MTDDYIPFNLPHVVGTEFDHIREAIATNPRPAGVSVYRVAAVSCAALYCASLAAIVR